MGKLALGLYNVMFAVVLGRFLWEMLHLGICVFVQPLPSLQLFLENITLPWFWEMGQGIMSLCNFLICIGIPSSDFNKGSLAPDYKLL